MKMSVFIQMNQKEVKKLCPRKSRPKELECDKEIQSQSPQISVTEEDTILILGKNITLNHGKIISSQ